GRSAATDICTLSLHDALPISRGERSARAGGMGRSRAIRADPELCAELRLWRGCRPQSAGLPPGSRAGTTELRKPSAPAASWRRRSEEHTSELQSRENLVCRLL